MVVKGWYGHFKKDVRFRYAVVGGILLFVLLADVVGYRWYARRYEGRAQMALSQAVEVLDKAARDSASTLWQEAENAFRDGYQRYPKSVLSPYMLSFWADTVVHQGDILRGIDLMNKAVLASSKKSPLHNALLIKRALMRMDATDEGLVAEGKKELHALAQDKENKQRDEALYFEGLVAFDKGDRAEAEKIWQELFTSFEDKSAWAQVARAKLEYRV